MRPIGAILCLTAIALNTAFGFAGSVLFCEHESGAAHLVSKAEHVQETHGESCHSPSGSSGAAATCDSCTDTEIESTGAVDNLTPSTERFIVKSPPFIDGLPITDLRVAAAPRLTRWVPVFRAPPVVVGAPGQFTSTVLFRC